VAGLYQRLARRQRLAQRCRLASAARTKQVRQCGCCS
jgi:hypothetical protein